VSPQATERDTISDICRFLTNGQRLERDAAPDWLVIPPGEEAYAHPHWPGVVIMFEPVKRHVITVRVKQEPTRRRNLGDKADIMRRSLPADTIAARASFGRLRRISAKY